jgi:hypothetical protein
VGQEDRQIPHWVQPSGGAGGEKSMKESFGSKPKDIHYIACITVVKVLVLVVS